MPIKPVRHTYAWKDSRGERWIVNTTWAEVDGRTECVGVELRSYLEDYGSRLEPLPDGLRPITTTVWRELPIGSQINRLRSSQARSLRRILRNARQVPPGRIKEMKKSLKQLDAPATGRPPEHGPEHYAKVAKVYTKAWQQGDAPTRAVSEHFGVTRSGAAKWVQRARKLGFLGPAPARRGRAGGIQQKEDK